MTKKEKKRYTIAKWAIIAGFVLLVIDGVLHLCLK